MKILTVCVSLAVLATLAPARSDEPILLPAQEKANRIQSFNLTLAGDKFLRSGAVGAAENDYRLAMRFWPANQLPLPGLAEALKAEGNPVEAIHVYRTLFYDTSIASGSAQDPLNLMNFALLLNETGHWQEAVSIYEKGIPAAPEADALRADGRFDPNVPMPTQLEALAHVGRGLEYQLHSDIPDAMPEFQSALTKAPDSAVVNYYYGYGWQRLGPAERAKYGTAQQAKAALQKAVKIGKGDVKAAAEKELRVAMNASGNAK